VIAKKSEIKTMLCIIAAMPEEIELLLTRITTVSLKTLPCLRYIYDAEYSNKSFVIAVSGVGKVNSAVTLQYVLDNYDIDRVINIGTAGGISDFFKKNDVMIAESAHQHDFDLGAIGGADYKRGGIPNISGDMSGFDAQMTADLKRVCKDLGYTLHTGAVASGDRFISDAAETKEFVRLYGAIVCEMEAAALIQTAAVNGFKKIAAVKAVSDKADGNAAEDFSDITGSKEKIRDIICKYIEDYA
jgi:adenosylhomocysteine nucleosidase